MKFPKYGPSTYSIIIGKRLALSSSYLSWRSLLQCVANYYRNTDINLAICLKYYFTVVEYHDGYHEVRVFHSTDSSVVAEPLLVLRRIGLNSFITRLQAILWIKQNWLFASRAGRGSGLLIALSNFDNIFLGWKCIRYFFDDEAIFNAAVKNESLPFYLATPRPIRLHNLLPAY